MSNKLSLNTDGFYFIWKRLGLVTDPLSPAHSVWQTVLIWVDSLVCRELDVLGGPSFYLFHEMTGALFPLH